MRMRGRLTKRGIVLIFSGCLFGLFFCFTYGGLLKDVGGKEQGRDIGSIGIVDGGFIIVTRWYLL